MAHRVIATVSDDGLGLVEENEVLGASEKLKEILVGLGYAKYYDDTKPIVGKSVNVYESGMVYPKDRQVFINDSIYKSNSITSMIWVPSEWDILVTGVNAR